MSGSSQNEVHGRSPEMRRTQHPFSFRPRHHTRTRRVTGVILAVALLSSLSAIAGDAQGTASQRVARAHDSATRSAQSEAALSGLPGGEATGALAAAAIVRPVDVSTLKIDWTRLGLDLDRAKIVDGAYVQTLSTGARVTYTVDPQLQKHIKGVLKRGAVPHGGAAVVEPSTGRVLALVSRSVDAPRMDDVALNPVAPSASVFKIVTAAALMETAGVSPTERVCYHGGRSRLTETNIKGSKRLDNRCGTLSDAVAWSINSLIAKLAYHRLSQEQIEQWAYKFGYGSPIPFELDLESSKVERVDDKLERARMAAGFWHTYLSPLHGALMSAAVLNDGVMMTPMIVEKLETKDGKVIYTRKQRRLRRVMKASTATKLKTMMQRTATVGTARKYFKHRREFPKSVTAGGKTGTLSRKKPSYLGYTWFVGFGEDTKYEGVEVAVASLACNTPTWRIKGPYISSEAIRKYIELERERRKSS